MARWIRVVVAQGTSGPKVAVALERLCQSGERLLIEPACLGYRYVVRLGNLRPRFPMDQLPHDHVTGRRGQVSRGLLYVKHQVE